MSFFVCIGSVPLHLKAGTPSHSVKLLQRLSSESDKSAQGLLAYQVHHQPCGSPNFCNSCLFGTWNLDTQPKNSRKFLSVPALKAVGMTPFQLLSIWTFTSSLIIWYSRFFSRILTFCRIPLLTVICIICFCHSRRESKNCTHSLLDTHSFIQLYCNHCIKLQRTELPVLPPLVNRTKTSKPSRSEPQKSSPAS